MYCCIIKNTYLLSLAIFEKILTSLLISMCCSLKNSLFGDVFGEGQVRAEGRGWVGGSFRKSSVSRLSIREDIHFV